MTDRIRLTEKPFPGNPWLEFERLRHGMDQLSKNIFQDETFLQSRPTVYPPMNIFETPDRIIIKAEIPGVQPENLEISIEGDTLSLQGKRDIKNRDRSLSYHRHEIESGSFSRAVTLPVKVDVEKIDAKLKNGILTITLDKAAEAKPRRITVHADES